MRPRSSVFQAKEYLLKNQRKKEKETKSAAKWCPNPFSTIVTATASICVCSVWVQEAKKKKKFWLWFTLSDYMCEFLRLYVCVCIGRMCPYTFMPPVSVYALIVVRIRDNHHECYFRSATKLCIKHNRIQYMHTFTATTYTMHNKHVCLWFLAPYRTQRVRQRLHAHWHTQTDVSMQQRATERHTIKSYTWFIRCRRCESLLALETSQNCSKPLRTTMKEWTNK